MACATDAYVFDQLVSERFPRVHAHLAAHGVLPETYVQKWFVGLGVHVLPLDALFPFFAEFLSRGFRFLFQFGLSLVEMLHDPLLAAHTPDRIYALLRMEDRTAESVAGS